MNNTKSMGKIQTHILPIEIQEMSRETTDEPCTSFLSTELHLQRSTSVRSF